MVETSVSVPRGASRHQDWLNDAGGDRSELSSRGRDSRASVAVGRPTPTPTRTRRSASAAVEDRSRPARRPPLVPASRPASSRPAPARATPSAPRTGARAQRSDGSIRPASRQDRPSRRDSVNRRDASRPTRRPAAQAAARSDWDEPSTNGASGRRTVVIRGVGADRARSASRYDDRLGSGRYAFSSGASRYDSGATGSRYDGTSAAIRYDNGAMQGIYDHASSLAGGYDRYPGAQVSRPRRRASGPRHERPGFKPDRVAMWAVILGLALILIAATSSHAAMFVR
jgi:hypothetical protein